MSEDWFAASLQEASAFLDKFEEQKSVTVKADSDIIAAILGLVMGAQVTYAMAQLAQNGSAAAALLETSQGLLGARPQDQ